MNSWIPQTDGHIWWLLTTVFLSANPSINLPAPWTLFNHCFTSLPPFWTLKCLRQSQCSWLLTDRELSQICKTQLYIYVLLYFWLQHMTISSYLLVDIILSRKSVTCCLHLSQNHFMLLPKAEVVSLILLVTFILTKTNFVSSNCSKLVNWWLPSCPKPFCPAVRKLLHNWLQLPTGTRLVARGEQQL